MRRPLHVVDSPQRLRAIAGATTTGDAVTEQNADPALGPSHGATAENSAVADATRPALSGRASHHCLK
jgi:hypothetical protein